jgi:hypothetical protein
MPFIFWISVTGNLSVYRTAANHIMKLPNFMLILIIRFFSADTLRFMKSYVPESPTQVKFFASRNSVCM